MSAQSDTFPRFLGEGLCWIVSFVYKIQYILSYSPSQAGPSIGGRTYLRLRSREGKADTRTLEYSYRYVREGKDLS